MLSTEVLVVENGLSSALRAVLLVEYLGSDLPKHSGVKGVEQIPGLERGRCKRRRRQRQKRWRWRWRHRFVSPRIPRDTKKSLLRSCVPSYPLSPLPKSPSSSGMSSPWITILGAVERETAGGRTRRPSSRARDRGKCTDRGLRPRPRLRMKPQGLRPRRN